MTTETYNFCTDSEKKCLAYCFGATDLSHDEYDNTREAIIANNPGVQWADNHHDAIIKGTEIIAILNSIGADGRGESYAYLPKTGNTPAITESTTDAPRGFGWCDKCESYCYGDCQAT